MSPAITPGVITNHVIVDLQKTPKQNGSSVQRAPPCVASLRLLSDSIEARRRRPDGVSLPRIIDVITYLTLVLTEVEDCPRKDVTGLIH